MARLDMAEINRLLAADALNFCNSFVPGGKVEGKHYRCDNIMGGKGQSMVVDVRGARAGKFKDFATGDGGDLLDLIAMQKGCELAEARKIALDWLGIRDHDGYDRQEMDKRRKAAESKRQQAEKQQLEKRIAGARRLWASCTPIEQAGDGGFVQAYLKGRGITAIPTGLRIGHSKDGVAFMAAAMVDAQGQIMAVHQTFLQGVMRDDGWQVTKHKGVPLWSDPDKLVQKKIVGPCGGCAVRIGSLRERIAKGGSARIAICEGIETGLSIFHASVLANPQQALPLPVLAAASAVNMQKVQLPAGIREVVICADHDPAKEIQTQNGTRHVRAGISAARKLAGILKRQGILPKVVLPPKEGMDFNDWLQQGDNKND